ncbi:O-antigen polysaccharide polymerase Wzy family protein [Actinomyces wuliandei]|uniref:O-antigen polysaccharide polymerase Wzy family protein n=2 Tax=Actinomyces wuliandei TaxID=2057743 RepID=UPI0013E3C61F|nr:O-antigen polysaccharide polymerase Wzy family protein [Actinomyces wuliandei]
MSLLTSNSPSAPHGASAPSSASRQTTAGQTALRVLTANLALAFMILWGQCDWRWGALLFMWLNLLMYSLSPRRRSVFFSGFLVSFFLLLLSQATLERIFHYPSSHAEPAALPTTVTILLIGLAASAAGYFLAGLPGVPRSVAAARSAGQRSRAAVIRARSWAARALHDRAHVRAAALAIIVLNFPLSAFWLVSTIARTGISGYLSLYTTDYIDQNAGILNLLGEYSSDFAFVAYLIYLATMPPRNEMILPTTLLAVIKSLYLMVGVRREFTVFAIVVVCYVVLRNRIDPGQGWFTRRTALTSTVSAVALMLLFTAMESLRGNGSSSSIVEFLYNQGVSVRVIDNVVVFGDRLPDQFYLAYFAHYGLVGRLLGVPSLQGNSFERAEIGGSLSHSLSRIALGDHAYLTGVSTGTSYLAEGYVQYGMVGVLGLALVVGAVLRYVDGLASTSYISNSLRMLMLPSLIWLPRGPATDFIGILVAPTTIMALVAIVGVVWISRGLETLRSRRQIGYRPHRPLLRQRGRRA